jgi:hypothetical protein
MCELLVGLHEVDVLRVDDENGGVELSRFPTPV